MIVSCTLTIDPLHFPRICAVIRISTVIVDHIVERFSSSNEDSKKLMRLSGRLLHVTPSRSNRTSESVSRTHTLLQPTTFSEFAGSYGACKLQDTIILHDQSNSRVVRFVNTGLLTETLLARIEKVRFYHPCYIAHALKVTIPYPA